MTEQLKISSDRRTELTVAPFHDLPSLPSLQHHHTGKPTFLLPNTLLNDQFLHHPLVESTHQ